MAFGSRGTRTSIRETRRNTKDGAGFDCANTAFLTTDPNRVAQTSASRGASVSREKRNGNVVEIGKGVESW